MKNAGEDVAFALRLALGVVVIFVFGCGRGREAPRSGLSDAQFVGLFVEVYRLYDRYGDRPDSLAVHRQAVLDRYGVTREDVVRYIAAHRDAPESWAPVLALLRERLGSEAAVTLEGFGAPARADTSKQKKTGP